MITVDDLNALPAVRHGFFTRTGGGSAGLYAANNCAFSANDDPGRVAANRAACAERLGVEPDSLVTVKQRHTADVVTVTHAWTWSDAPVADAMVTAVPDLALGILTADCAPVLLADPVAGVIGAAHAGWKGAFDGVLANTVAAMTALGAQSSRLIAAIGPCIGQASYEVGPEFVARFRDRDAGLLRFFASPKPNGHSHFDLPGFVRAQLTEAGVGRVVGGGWDTCAHETQFFSYRRAVLRKEPDYGRQLSAIALVEAA
ncbi:MAG: peptidoglycan editing factor PgeF [Rhodospirillaceae bacterium]|nr:peptidoglycan editing factor PgeF [Rhodospirillaceae bacterium]